MKNLAVHDDAQSNRVKEIAEEDWRRLQNAAKNGDSDLVVSLLNSQVPSHRDSDKETDSPLYLATANGHAKVLQILLKNTTADKISDGFITSLLLSATTQGRASILRLLFGAEASSQASRIMIDIPLLAAAKLGEDGCVEALLRANATVHSKKTNVLLSACEGGHLRTAQLLLEAQANIDTRDVSGDTPLHKATARGDLPLMRLLLSANASVWTKNEWNWTPLVAALSTRQPEPVVKLLLDAKSPTFTPGGPPLIKLAAHYGLNGILRILLDTCPDLEAEKDQIDQALSMATANRHAQTARILLDAKADIETRNSHGWTCLHQAIAYGQIDMVRLLLEANARLDTRTFGVDPPLLFAVSRNVQNLELIQLLIDANADIEDRDDEGSTALLNAATWGRTRILETLLYSKAELEVKDRQGRTPLLHAIGCGDVNITHMLLSARADITAGDFIGTTPLMAAASRKGEVPLLRMLLEESLSRAQGDSGQAALHSAVVDDTTTK